MDEQLKKKIDLLIRMDREKDEHVEFLKQYRLLIEEIAQNIDLIEENHIAFQDKWDVVYKIEPATGEYVEYKHWTLKRTRRPGEKRGTLSIEEAKRLGFEMR
jgi:hypothetical protein